MAEQPTGAKRVHSDDDYASSDELQRPSTSSTRKSGFKLTEDNIVRLVTACQRFFPWGERQGNKSVAWGQVCDDVNASSKGLSTGQISKSSVKGIIENLMDEYRKSDPQQSSEFGSGGAQVPRKAENPLGLLTERYDQFMLHKKSKDAKKAEKQAKIDHENALGQSMIKAALGQAVPQVRRPSLSKGQSVTTQSILSSEVSVLVDATERDQESGSRNIAGSGGDEVLKTISSSCIALQDLTAKFGEFESANLKIRQQELELEQQRFALEQKREERLMMELRVKQMEMEAKKAN
ncbi:hypothetical protein MP228_003992 [Amoeboaphelidium protococcarum]|nr:hypothetical protein MP228_003992 [Amoeboaphelidium protococcarum]